MRVKYTVRPMDPIHHPDKTEVVEPQLVGREQQPPEDAFLLALVLGPKDFHKQK